MPIIKSTPDAKLTDFYTHVQQQGSLLTPDHAWIWTRGTLNMLGVNLSKGARNALTKALPEELQKQLSGVFWLAFFRNTNLTAYEFQNRVARRSGNTDAQFAKRPVMAVFGALKKLVGENVSRQIAQDLAPEVRELWEKAV